MRVPPSVIVMSLLTAASFGLAIRDTFAKKDSVVDEDEDYSLELGDRRAKRRDHDALAEYEREVAREAEERARTREDRLGKLDELYGSKPASMGALFDGILLGADAGSFQPESARKRIERASEDGFILVSFDVDTVALRGVAVELSGRDYDSALGRVVDPCETLHDKLVAAWGPSTGGSWLDPATHQRARLDRSRCTLRFSRYLEPSEWTQAVPFDAIGKPADKLVAKLGPDATEYDDAVEWQVPGLGAGGRSTKFTAFVAKGKIVGIQATTDSDFDSILAVRDGLTARLGAAPKRDRDGVLTWRKKLPVTLEQEPDRVDRQLTYVALFAGKDPWSE